MTDERFSAEDSLHLIHSMISKTKQGISDNAFYFLLWGWITFIACCGQFVLKHYLEYEKHYLVWWLIVPGIILSAWKGIREDRNKTAKTYIDESMKYLWMGMGISFLVLSMILSKLGWGTSVFPFFIMLYGLGTFVSGNFLQFRPLLWGGILAWVLAIISVFTAYDYQILFGAVAILVSYIIPAYLLRRKNKTITS